MNQAALQQKVYDGYAKAALRIGKVAAQYRPSGPFFTMGAPLASLLVAFTTNMGFTKFNAYAHPVWTSLHDGSLTTPGDYLVTEDGTWFIAAQQSLLPILAVSCNRVASMFRVSQENGVGVIGYAGDTGASEVAIMTGWPCSILQGTKGEKNPAQLPGDERTPWWILLLPESAGTILRNADIIQDDLGRRYVISSPELTDLGWRLTASMQVP